MKFAHIREFFSDKNAPNYLLCCGDAADVLPQFPPQSVNCCITSPPYWQQRQYSGASQLGNEPTVEEYVQHLRQIFRWLKPILMDDGSLWLNLGDTYKNKNLMGVPWRVAFALQADGWILRNAVIWDKVKGNPCNAKDKLRNAYEYLFHFVKNFTYYYDLDAIRTPPTSPKYKDGRMVTPTGVNGSKYKQQIFASQELNSQEKQNALAALDDALQKVASGEMPDFRMLIRGKQRSTHSDSPAYSGRAKELIKQGFCILPYHKNGAKPDDVWGIIPEDKWRQDSHFAVFPKQLCEIPIKATCPVGGLVLDPFSGTGTAIVAALELNRRGIGIDTSAEYLEIAKTRIIDWNKFLSCQQLSLF
ncbi:MAG: site-specific DNA-methyltransferase [Oscillatoriaceae cyanobacterium]